MQCKIAQFEHGRQLGRRHVISVEEMFDKEDKKLLNFRSVKRLYRHYINHNQTSFTLAFRPLSETFEDRNRKRSKSQGK